MARKYFRARRTRTSMSEISLTPLIDTALTLLIIFMVATPMLHNSIKINLPDGKTKEAAAISEELIVTIMDNGTLFFNGMSVTQDNLIPTVKQAMAKSKKDRPVFVKADKMVNYGKVIQVVDQLKMVGGIEYVALATKKA